MDLSLRSIKTNHWSADIFEKHVTSMIYTLKLAIQSGDTGQLTGGPDVVCVTE